MVSLASVLRKEQPRINAVLEKEIAALPESARNELERMLGQFSKIK